MHDLLAKDGSIYVHCDWRVNSYIRLVMDELFGKENFINNIIWSYRSGGASRKESLPRKHDYILFYRKGKHFQVNTHYERQYLNKPFMGSKTDEEGRFYVDTILRDVLEGAPNIVKNASILQYNMRPVLNLSTERLDYPTQKPEGLIKILTEIASNEGDLVADFFVGSGTTAAVAEKLRRKWIAADLGKFAIHTTRKRMIGVQRQRKADGEDYRAFEILNLGKYERQHYIGVNPNLREEEQQKQSVEREKAFIDLILRAYAAEKTDGFTNFQGKKVGRLIAIGPIDTPVTRLFVEEIILECRKHQITRVDVLGFEFEMGLFPTVLEEAESKGIDLTPKFIPADVFDKRAVEQNQVVFHNVAFIEVKPHITEGRKDKPATVTVELTDFSVFYSQDSISHAEQTLKNRGSRIVVEQGQVVKVSKDADGIVSREVLTKHWTDWIDYWSVDFDFESKHEIIRMQDSKTGEWEEQWTGDYVFENEWQSFRTKKDRSLELTSVVHECTPGRRKLAVKVVDIFGNDTMAIVEVSV